MIALGVFLGLVYWITNGRGVPRGLRTILAIASIGSILIGVVEVAGVGTLAPTAPGTVGGPIYTVTATVGDSQNSSNVVFDQNAHTAQVQVSYDISDAAAIYASGTTELNFTIGRSDTGTQDVTTAASLVTVGLVPKSDGSGTTYPIVALNADGTYQCTAEKGPNAAPISTNKATTILLAGGGSNYVRFNITWNANAVGNQVVFDTAPITLQIADQTWTVTELLVVKQA